jgi:hypothetical protein
MLSTWRHSGFNVFCGNRISPDDGTAMENLARYIIRASFSQERMQYLDQEGTVVYTSKDGETTKSFPALEWLAAMCAHIPNRGEQMVRYYGYYSNVSRGKRQKEGLDDAIPCILEPPGNEKAFRSRKLADRPAMRKGCPVSRGPGRGLSESFALFENRDPSARWTFFAPAPPRFAAKTKLALRAQTVVFADATLRGQGTPKNLQCALPGSDFQSYRFMNCVESVQTGRRFTLARLSACRFRPVWASSADTEPPYRPGAP